MPGKGEQNSPRRHNDDGQRIARKRDRRAAGTDRGKCREAASTEPRVVRGVHGRGYSMSEMITALRRAANAELPSLEAAPPAQPEAPSGYLDEALAAFFSTMPPTDLWLAVIEELAETGEVEDVPAGPAAAAAQRLPRARPISVEEALRLAPRESRAHLQTALHLSADAAEELLERPAAALARRTPAEVRALARLVARPTGELFADIASSWRSGLGFVYAYRPGVEAETPAESDANRDLSDLIDWGEALLA
jgi:hypothetical protein